MVYQMLERLYETIYALREAIFGEIRARFVSPYMEIAIRRDRINDHLLSLFGKNAEFWNEYRKFTNDVQTHLEMTEDDDMDDGRILDILDWDALDTCAQQTETYSCYDPSMHVNDEFYSIYIVRYQRHPYVCIYRFGRYFHTSRHPPSKPIACKRIPISKN